MRRMERSVQDRRLGVGHVDSSSIKINRIPDPRVVLSSNAHATRRSKIPMHCKRSIVSF